MAFLQPDEHLLLMDWPKTGEAMMNAGELQALRGLGIRTALCNPVDWNAVEPREGRFDFSAIDARLETLFEQGYKVLLLACRAAAQWFPDDWYARYENGNILRGVLSPWHAEAQAGMREFLRMMRERYNGAECLVICGHQGDGEAVFMNQAAWFDPAGLASFKERWNTEELPRPEEGRTELWMRETFIAQMKGYQQILIDNPQREIWSLLHPDIAFQAGLYGNGCKFIPGIYDAYMELEPAYFGQIWFTCHQHTRCFEIYQQLIKTCKLKAFGGAEYASGLPETVPFAWRNNLKGLLIHPLHPFTGEVTLKPWMLGNIERAIKAMEGM